MEELKTVWDFVERYYPEHSMDNEIAYNEDLQKIADREINGTAEEMYNEMIEDGMTDYEIIDWVKNELEISNAYIFKRAIQGFIDQQKK